MAVTDYTTNRHLPYPTGADYIPEGPAELEAIANALDGENRGEIDFLQVGVVSATDWSFTATMESSSECKLGSTATVGGVAWLPLAAIGLVRSVTTAAKLSALKPASLPGSGKYLTVGFELTPSTSDAAATVSVVSGAEQTTQALAEVNSPAITAGNARVRDVVVLNTAGVYSIASQTDRRSQVDLTHMPGDLIFTATSSRFGCLPCEGQAVPRTSYPNLFAAIGTTYGAGNGTTTFGLPDYRGRVPMGAGTGTGGEESESFPARSLGQKVGALVHKLTVGQLASHSHGGKTGTSTTGAGGFHSHLILASTTNNPASGGAWEGGGGEWTFGGVSFQSPTYVGVDTGITNGSGEHTHTVPALAISAEGGGEAHNIVQPSTTCNVWIKF